MDKYALKDIALNVVYRFSHSILFVLSSSETHLIKS